MTPTDWTIVAVPGGLLVGLLLALLIRPWDRRRW